MVFISVFLYFEIAWLRQHLKFLKPVLGFLTKFKIKKKDCASYGGNLISKRLASTPLWPTSHLSSKGAILYQGFKILILYALGVFSPTVGYVFLSSLLGVIYRNHLFWEYKGVWLLLKILSGGGEDTQKLRTLTN